MWLTADLPGSGGHLEARAEDFVVDEVPAYLPSGAGEHVFVRLEKIGITTPEALKRAARVAGVRAHDVAAAGFKDKDARARQWICFPWPIKTPLPDLSALESEELRVLEVSRHGNKLRRGHQRGNIFTITVRGVPEDGVSRAQAILERLRVLGVPNTFGPQRFGRDGDNAERALAMLRGEARAPSDRRVFSLLMSALQSKVFNDVLFTRASSGFWARALEGDVMQKHDSHGLFDVTDPAAEQPRVDALAISPTGPLPGPRMRRASGVPGQIEEEACARCGIDAAVLEKLDSGTRRALRYPLDQEARIEAVSPDVYRLFCFLPSGAFATVLLGELIKPPSGALLRSFDAE